MISDERLKEITHSPCSTYHWECLDMAVELIRLRAEPRWIPCSERLPHESEIVLMAIKPYVISLGFRAKGSGEWSYLSGVEAENVTHWRPLPEPPKAA